MRRYFLSLSIAAFLSAGSLAWLASGQITGREPSSVLPGQSGQALPGKVDVNRASLEELCRLPGIAREAGQKIIKHRPYKRLDDLVTKKILSKKEFARVREYVSVGAWP
jgi:DNA uptake protein ComE-like DNA-binding protein